MPDVKEVRILNTENNVYCFLSIREDRLRDFYQFILTDRRVPTEPWMPGLSYAANLGCTAIFCRIPPKFPALDGLV